MFHGIFASISVIIVFLGDGGGWGCGCGCGVFIIENISVYIIFYINVFSWLSIQNIRYMR